MQRAPSRCITLSCGLLCLLAPLPPASSAASLLSVVLQPCADTVQLWEPSTSVPNPQQGTRGSPLCPGIALHVGTARSLYRLGGPAQVGTTESQTAAGLQMIHRSTIRVFFWCSMGTDCKAPNVFPFGNLREQVSCTGLSLGPSGVEWGDTCFLTSQTELLNTSQLLVSFCDVLVRTLFPNLPLFPSLIRVIQPPLLPSVSAPCVLMLHTRRLGWFPDSPIPKLSLWPEDSDRPC